MTARRRRGRFVPLMIVKVQAKDLARAPCAAAARRRPDVLYRALYKIFLPAAFGFLH